MIDLDRIAEVLADKIAARLGQRQQPPDDRMLSVADAAEHLGMSPSWVRGQIRDGHLPATKLGRSLRVRQSDLDALGSRPTTKTDGTPKAWAMHVMRGGR